MLRALFQPTAANAAGWAAAVAVVAAWQYYDGKKSSGDWNEDSKKWNDAVMAKSTPPKK